MQVGASEQVGESVQVGASEQVSKCTSEQVSKWVQVSKVLVCTDTDTDINTDIVQAKLC